VVTGRNTLGASPHAAEEPEDRVPSVLTTNDERKRIHKVLARNATTEDAFLH